MGAGMIASILAIQAIYAKIFRNVTSQLAATAFTLSLLCVLVIWIIYASSLSIGGQSWRFTVNQLGLIPAVAFISLLLLMFFVLWFILYIQYMKEAEDVYSRLREKLKGKWTAYYDYTIAERYIFPNRQRANFEFTINQNRKLEMHFDPDDNLLFSDVDQNISQLSLRHVEANKYSLMYFFSNKRTLREEIAGSIEPDYPNHDVSKIEVEAFGILTFEEPPGDQKIMQMTGSWYDLNGQMRTLGVLLRERGRAEANNALKDYKTKLSSLVEEHSVSAKMGDVEFRRND